MPGAILVVDTHNLGWGTARQRRLGPKLELKNLDADASLISWDYMGHWDHILTNDTLAKTGALGQRRLKLTAHLVFHTDTYDRSR
jgi:hypothetical protein